MRHTVLLIDDEPNVLEGLTRVLRNEAYDILTANSAEEAAGILEGNAVDLILSDEEMPGMSGTEFLGKVAQEYPDTVRLVLTGRPTLPTALRAINEGKVYQFFTKPCNEIDLAITIRRALEQKELLAKSRELLEVTKRQSALIDEARLACRLSGASHRERAEAIAKEGKPADTCELLEEMEGAVSSGRELLEDIRKDQDLRCDTEPSAATASP
jgi:two-component system, probable response regulator PhcQ